MSLLEIDLFRLIVITIPTILLGFHAYVLSNNHIKKLFVIMFYSFLYLYAGFGGSYASVNNFYFIYYLLFLLGYHISFVLIVNKCFFKNIKLKEINNYFLTTRFMRIVIVFLMLFFLLKLLLLVYPENNFLRLLNPPSPDLASVFFKRFSNFEVNVVVKIINYFLLLTLPFYYISLYFFRRKPIVLFILLYLPLYITYCQEAYIGRGAIILATFVFFLTLYIFNKKLRKILVVAVILFFPSVLGAIVAYGRIRLGANVVDRNFVELLQYMFLKETGFPRFFISVYDSNKYPSIISYFFWLVTGFLPGFVKGSLGDFYLNYEIAEIIRGINVGAKGFSVTLTGLVTEGYYLFGNFIILHGLFCGFLNGMFIRFSSSLKVLTVFNFYIIFFLSYNFNRAGISGVYSTLSGGFLLLYLVLYINFKRSRKFLTQK